MYKALWSQFLMQLCTHFLFCGQLDGDCARLKHVTDFELIMN